MATQMERLYQRRSFSNMIALSLSVAATVFGLFWLVWILWTALTNGLAAMNLALFTQMTPPPGDNGGLLNAFFGSLVMSLLAIAIGVRTMGHFSAIAGMLALALIVIPVVVRTTDEMLKLVPAAMREAALSLG